MKSFSVVLCLLVAVQVAWSQHSEEMKECADEHNIKKDDLKAFLDKKNEPTKDYKCFLKCMLEHLEILKEDGTISSASMKGSKEASLIPYTDECAAIAKKTDDLCELAYKHHECMREKTPADEWKKVVENHTDTL